MKPSKLSIVFVAASVLNGVASADNFVTVRDLTRSVNQLPAEDFAPLRIVEIIVEKPASSMQAHFVRYVRFFQLKTISPQPLRPEFWHAIPVYKGGRRMDVALIDSPDCSVETIALHSYQNGLVDLLVSQRRRSKDNPFPPQNTPVPQQVDVFRLTRAGESSHGYPRVIFKWIRSQLLRDPVCTETDVDGALGNVPP